MATTTDLMGGAERAEGMIRHAVPVEADEIHEKLLDLGFDGRTVRTALWDVISSPDYDFEAGVIVSKN